MQVLLTVIVTWLSLNFGLPADFEHPQVQIVPRERIVAVRLGGLVTTQTPQGTTTSTMGASNGDSLVAVYDDARRTIYLPEGWTGNSPAESSVLVHEMVHHLQNTGRLTYECPQAREDLAYQAQNQWLTQFGDSLEKAFEIDALTLMLRSRCGVH